MAQASEKRILVVDDEPDVRNFLATCIEDAGFQVETAVDGEDALAKIKADAPDLMTLDMVMPRKSGIELMRALRAEEKWAKLPVIVITAHARDEFGSDDIKSFNAFTSNLRPRYTMEKPVTPVKLLEAIHEILGVTPVEEDSLPAERASIIQMINETGPETLDKIRSVLKEG